jgi:3-oxoacyl-[acyl-carrier-protein] synthase I
MTQPFNKLSIVASTQTSAAGRGNQALLACLRELRCALAPNRFTSKPLLTMVGEVHGLDQHVLPPALQSHDARSHRLAHLALGADGFAGHVARVVEQTGAARVGLVLATTTSTIHSTELAYRLVDSQGFVPPQRLVPGLYTLHATGAFVQRALGLEGPAITVSTACSSGNKAIGVAQRWLSMGVVDAVVVAGVDALCDSTLFGFSSLQLVAQGLCRPFDAQREGINLGEGAGYLLLTRASDAHALGCRAQAHVVGLGESSDANHPSAPQPDGVCIESATRTALHQAGLQPSDVDYLNLHGTATPQNDAVEAAMVARVYPARLHASATKGITGHLMGAAGVVESIVCLLAMAHGHRPGTANTQQLDAVCGPQIRCQGADDPVRVAVNNAFGFGGSNAVLVMEAAS